jgi:hypothetical protein
MTNPPARKPIGLYIGLTVVAIFVIAGIAFVVFIKNFLDSDEGKRMMGEIMAAERVEGVVPELSTALQKYQAAKGTFPDTIDELSSYGLSNEGLSTTKELLKYTKPAKDAPEDTVIFDSGKRDFIKGSSMQIQITKGGDAYQITRTPLNQRNPKVNVR